MRSLRSRLVFGTFFAAFVVYLAASFILYTAIRQTLLAEFDATLIAKARTLAALTDWSKKGVRLDLEPDQMPELSSPQSHDFFSLRTREGREITRSKSLAENDWVDDLKASDFGGNGEEKYGFYRHGNDHRVRYVRLRFIPAMEDDEDEGLVNREPVILLVAHRTTDFDNQLRKLLELLAGVFGVTAIISGALMGWVIKKGLAPLANLARSIQMVGENELGQRINMEDAPAELSPVVERLNELLGRLEQTFNRERAFTADVAHELRTPLASLMTALEVCGSRRRSEEDYAATVGKCLKVSREMRGMVENLLTLARADAQLLNISPESIDLGILLTEVWPEFEPRAIERGVKVEWSVREEIEIVTDPGLLASVLRNLLDNAVIYVKSGGKVSIEAAMSEQTAVVCISNDGSDIAAEEAAKVFDRFWRKDTARSTAGQHCGLGLALCQRIVRLLGGTIGVETAAGGEFRVTLCLPAKK